MVTRCPRRLNSASRSNNLVVCLGFGSNPTVHTSERFQPANSFSHRPGGWLKSAYIDSTRPPLLVPKSKYRRRHPSKRGGPERSSSARAKDADCIPDAHTNKILK
eukprot:scaffold13696_cov106-Isochrysis_galbana.AAC.1